MGTCQADESRGLTIKERIYSENWSMTDELRELRQRVGELEAEVEVLRFKNLQLERV
jgi:hypothetical protein